MAEEEIISLIEALPDSRPGHIDLKETLKQFASRLSPSAVDILKLNAASGGGALDKDKLCDILGITDAAKRKGAFRSLGISSNEKKRTTTVGAGLMISLDSKNKIAPTASGALWMLGKELSGEKTDVM